MATVIFSGPVLNQVVRVVDNGHAETPRLVVELQQSPDAMGGLGWATLDPIPTDMLAALLVAAGVIAP